MGLRKKNSFPGIFGHLVVYPNGTHVGSLPASQDPSIIVNRRDMDKLQERIESAFRAWDRPGRPRGSQFTRRKLEYIEAILCDNCRFVISAAAGIDSDETTISELTEQQFSFFQGVLHNPRLLVRGVAGSGKTLMAQLSADMFARRGQRVLLLCYNKLLAASLQAQEEELPYDVASFHAFCFKLCRQAGIECQVPPGDAGNFWREDAPNLMNEAIDELGDACKYDAILVDEGQDFMHDWWMAVQLLLHEAGTLCIFHDPDQTLYDAEQAFPADVAQSGLNLDENCRNTKRIASYCGKVIDKSVKSFERSPEGIAPTLLDSCPDAAKRADQVRRRVAKLLDEGFTPSQIAVLSPWGPGNARCAMDHLDSIHSRKLIAPAGGDSVADLGSKLAEWRADGGIWTGTVKSFKGLEAACIVLTDLPEPGPAYFTFRDLYVASSRAQHLLFLIPSDEKAHAALSK